MNNLKELYQEVIVDHSRSPRNCHPMQDANEQAEGFNPLCGDRLKLFLKIQDNHIIDVSFEGCGCAISTASASLMTEMIQGKTLEEAEKLFETFHEALTKEDASFEKLGKLIALVGVKAYPMRVKCATLPWHTLKAALHQQKTPVSTE